MGEGALLDPEQMCMTEMQKQGRPTMGCGALCQRLVFRLLCQDARSAPLQAPSQKDHKQVAFVY